MCPDDEDTITGGLGDSDFTHCKTRWITADLYDCLNLEAVSCEFAMSFGYGRFCKHPNRQQFEGGRGS